MEVSALRRFSGKPQAECLSPTAVTGPGKWLATIRAADKRWVKLVFLSLAAVSRPSWLPSRGIPRRLALQRQTASLPCLLRRVPLQGRNRVMPARHTRGLVSQFSSTSRALFQCWYVYVACGLPSSGRQLTSETLEQPHGAIWQDIVYEHIATRATQSTYSLQVMLVRRWVDRIDPLQNMPPGFIALRRAAISPANDHYFQQCLVEAANSKKPVA